ncbi:MAG: hypothetical protein LBV29_00065 [Azoarcus sp.]|jgi:hypothetical protein|nr:hypothetical protein [Azoarcus sp.]
MPFLSEADLETALLEQFASLGYAAASDDIIGPDGSALERESHDTVILQKRLKDAVSRLNPALPPEAQANTIRKHTQSVFPPCWKKTTPSIRAATRVAPTVGNRQWATDREDLKGVGHGG